MFTNMRHHPTMRIVLSLGITLALLLSCRSESRAEEIYVCGDGKGHTHFTNVPESPACAPFKTTTKITYTSLRTWSNSGSSSYSYRPIKGDHAYDAYINHYGTHYNIDPNLIKAVISAESNFDRNAVSRRGAQGLMQLMPETARMLKVSNPFHPGQNIAGGTRYLRMLLNQFKGNLALTLAAYNAGPTLVSRIQKVPRIPETIHYVKRVLATYQAYGVMGEEVAETTYRSTIRVSHLLTR